VRLVVSALVSVAAVWVVFVAVLVVVRPKGIDLREASRLVPDLVRALRSLASAPDRPAGVRWRLAVLMAYLAFPVDLVPDFVPVLGYADDVVVCALVLRSVVRRAGPAVLERHWRGTPAGLAVVQRLAGLRT